MAAETHSNRERVEVLDLLRALAVLAVIAYHYCFRGAAGDDFTQVSLPALVPVAKYGFLGVQLFFVISGFVIAWSTEGRSAVEFGIARIARIYPGFIVCMTLTFIVTLAIGAPHFQTSLMQWLSNYVIAAPALKQQFMDGAYWSLVYEFIFYAWIALLMKLGWFRRHADVIVIAWMALAVANRELQSVALQRIFLTDQSGFFAAGLMIYEMYRGRRDAIVRLLLGLSTIVAIGQAIHATDWNRGHFHVPFDNSVVTGISILTVATVWLAVRVHRLPLRPSIVLAVGGITYPLYLIHQNIGYMVFNKVGDAMPAWLLLPVTAAAMMLSAWTVWRFVERPGQRAAKRILRSLVSILADQAPAAAAPVVAQAIQPAGGELDLAPATKRATLPSAS